MFDKATGRVVAVIVLLIVIAAALRGYLPGVDRTEQQRPPDSGASLVYVAALLSVSLVIMAVALIARLRDPRRVPAGAEGLRDRFSDGRGRPRWRVVIVGAAVLVAWLLLLWLLSRFFVPQGRSFGQAQPAPPSTVPTPSNNTPSRPTPPGAGADRDVLRFLIVGTVALLAMIVVGAVISRPSTSGRCAAHRAGCTHSARPPPRSPPQSLVRAAESGLAEIEDPNHEPRRGDHRVLCGDGTRTDAFSRRRPAGLRHADRGFGPRRRTPCAARRQRGRAGGLVRRGAVQPARDGRGASRRSALRVLRLVLDELRSAA